jgi:hypothetical protein
VSGTGVAGQVAFWTGTGTQTGSDNLFWDNTNGRFSTGVLSPTASMQVGGIGTPFGPATSGSAAFVGFRIGKPGFAVALDMGTQPNNSPVFSWIQSRTLTNYSQNLLLALQPNGGNVIIGGVTTDAGFRLDVNGTARVQGDLTITGTNINMSALTGVIGSSLVAGLRNNGGSAGYVALGFSSNLQTAIALSSFQNSNTGFLTLISDSHSLTTTYANSAVLEVRSTTRGFLPPRMTGTQRNAISSPATGLEVYNSTNNSKDIYNGSAWVNVVSSSNFDGLDIAFGTSTGTKIGTATSQKLSFWNATPNVQPTTAITAGAFVANTSGITDDTATFDGYTMGQVVAALRRIGALA